MIIAAHFIIYSTNPELDRAFIRDVLKFPHVDAGEGWLIFALPPAELAVHPFEINNLHEFYLMTDDIQELIEQMKTLNINCSRIQQQNWGLLTTLTLPGGGNLQIYQPLHARPEPWFTSPSSPAPPSSV